jgi:putative beta-lysine N-acetyltransferase
MYDLIEKIGNSVIQHGKYNDRIYLMKLDPSDVKDITKEMDQLATKNRYTKIFAKIPESYIESFIDAGFKKEAFIPNFYNGRDKAVFLAKYLSEDRENVDSETQIIIDKNIEIAKAKAGKGVDKILPEKYSMRQIPESDVEQLASLYKVVFPTYPFPIHDPEYLKEVMATHVDFFGVYEGTKLIAASSAEMDKKSLNAEMTDFATDPEYLGQGLALFLLELMDNYMKEKKFPTVYTIARSMSAGMNITFAKLGYKFTGTLINNTNISGSIESMNVWYKRL